MTFPVQPVPSVVLAARERPPPPQRRGAAQPEAPRAPSPPVGCGPTRGGVARCPPCEAGLDERQIASTAQRGASAYRSVMLSEV